MSQNKEAVQQRIAELYFERNKLYSGLPAKRLILNIGCGSGSFFKYYPHKNSFVINIDSGTDIASGYPAYGPYNKGFEAFTTVTDDSCRRMNIANDVMLALWKFPSNMFDMIVCGQVIEHFSMRDLEWVMTELNRILDKSGLLQIDTVTTKLGESTKGHKTRFSLSSLSKLLTRFGFKEQELFEFASRNGVWALFERA